MFFKSMNKFMTPEQLPYYNQFVHQTPDSLLWAAWATPSPWSIILSFYYKSKEWFDTAAARLVRAFFPSFYSQRSVEAWTKKNSL